ncbi:hypothetical protein GCM10011410_21890 [Hoyosella rhizosphaerae]|uniref:Uncharacterized protein n=2 Tax=Hoyosella rhizosphaerae TaxID=1755582 RepID=A0A916XEZ9_9ACTN|nr:hypothetical protein GCM10011410_21890 [Hoyosella rhizosphaerae]
MEMVTGKEGSEGAELEIQRMVLPMSGLLMLWREDGASQVARESELPMLESQPDGLMRRPLPPNCFKLNAENLADIPGSSW